MGQGAAHSWGTSPTALLCWRTGPFCTKFHVLGGQRRLLCFAGELALSVLNFMSLEGRGDAQESCTQLLILFRALGSYCSPYPQLGLF